MSHKGFDIVGYEAIDRWYKPYNHNYHLCDHGGRAYLCGCMPSIRDKNIRGMQKGRKAFYCQPSKFDIRLDR